MKKELPPEGEEDECVVPPPLEKTQLLDLILGQNEHEVQEIIDYVEWQCNKKREGQSEEERATDTPEERVEHAEKVKTERVYGDDYDVWDVHTNLNRWWVISSPTNLYSQELMPSLDYTLSFHIGLMARVHANRELKQDDTSSEMLLVTSRKILQAQEAFDAADEAEEFQAVGMLCREVLTTFVREIIDAGMLADLADPPKTSDFQAWAEQVIGARAAGASAEYVRGYLNAVCKKGWQLVNWLTHAKNATRDDARLALASTEGIVDELTMLVLRSLAHAPEQCGRCGSFKITVTWRPGEGENGEYVAQCDVCGAQKIGVDQEEK